MKSWNSLSIDWHIIPLFIKVGCLASLLVFSSPIDLQAQGELELVDRVYSDKIKTVQLYPALPVPVSQVWGPVTSLRSDVPLILEFDELFNDALYYQAKLIHCNADWSKSSLSDLQFLTDYNEFNIAEYEYSFNTKVPYVHYRFKVPQVNIPGNYVLVVYPEGDTDAIILSRRFMVYESRIRFSDKYNLSQLSSYSRTQQQLLFEVDYRGMDIVNPSNSVFVNIVQNQRWDNAKINVRPSFVKESQKIIEYRNFTETNTFDGGNEFRFFDIRSIKYFGQGVATAKLEKKENNVWINTDASKNGLAYGIEQDVNGQFFIENLERKIPTIENDYAQVFFTLSSPKLKGKVFVGGALADWRYTNENQMKYETQSSAYEGSLIIKQGFYNYQYVVQGGTHSDNYFEGDFGETENKYEIFVYYRPPDLQADLLVGYLKLDRNQKR